jgi:hypothetical protein
MPARSHQPQPAEADGPRWVYWSQVRVVGEVLAAGDGDLAGCADAGQVATHLRARDMLIVCGPDAVTLEGPAPEDSEPECQAPESEGQPMGGVLGNGQLILPLPTGPSRKKNGFGQWIPRPSRGKRDLHRDHPERE